MEEEPATIAATITTAPPPTYNNESKSLSGVPPPVFNGDRDKSETFLDKFLGYELVNGDHKSFRVPFMKAALFLSYCNGNKVDV